MTSKGKILVTGDPHILHDDLLIGLRSAGYIIDRCPEKEPSIDKIREKIVDVEGYLFGGFEYLSSEAINEARNLKVVSLLGEDAQGFLDLPTARSKGILVTNTPGATTNAVAEFIFAEIFIQSRQMRNFVCRIVDSDSDTPRPYPRELGSLTVGIIGLGRIGQRLAQIIRGVSECRVLYWNRTRKIEVEHTLGLDFVAINDLARESDFVVIAVATSNETELLASGDLISCLRPGATLISVSKSRVIDFDSLCKALSMGNIRAAYLDWLDRSFHENLNPEHAIDGMMEAAGSRLIVTPHIANNTLDAWQRMAEMATASLLNALQTADDPYLVRI